MKKTKKAFTLVELLVVIAILAVLATVGIVGYTSFTKKAKESNDKSVISQINLALQASEVADGKPQTLAEALQVVEEAGFVVANLTPSTEGYDYIYDMKNNRFALMDGNKVVSEATDHPFEEGVNAWQLIATGQNLSSTRSNYLKPGWSGNIQTSTGLDCGVNENLHVTYDHQGGHQEVSIRLLGDTSSLVINAPNDTKVAEIDYSQKGCASKSVNSLINYDKEKSLFPEKPTIIQLHWNDDLDPFITASLNSSLPYNIISRTQKVFKRLLVTPSPNTQLDKDVIEHLFQYYGKIVSHRFTPTSAHITYSTPQEGVNALYALDELVLPSTTLQIHFGRVEPLLSNWKEQRISLCISRLPLTAKRSHIKIACAGFGEVYIRPTFLPDNLPLRKRIYVDFVNQKEGKEALENLQNHFVALGFYGVHVNAASNRLPNDNNNNSSNAATSTTVAAQASSE